MGECFESAAHHDQPAGGRDGPGLGNGPDPQTRRRHQHTKPVPDQLDHRAAVNAEAELINDQKVVLCNLLLVPVAWNRFEQKEIGFWSNSSEGQTNKNSLANDIAGRILRH